MYAFAQFLWDYRAEIFGAIVALDQALAATGKVRANSTGQLFLHSLIAAIQAQRTSDADAAGPAGPDKLVVAKVATAPKKTAPMPPPAPAAARLQIDEPSAVTT